MRLLLACLLATIPVEAAAGPVDQPSHLPQEWQARVRPLLRQVVEVPSVPGRGNVPKVAELLADQLRAAGFPADAVEIRPYMAGEGDSTAALIARWTSPAPRRRPILILGHMDVVEARREDWQRDPFALVEEGGYFYGRGTLDMKAQLVAITIALAKLRAEGFVPTRDIILFFTGDEETAQTGARLGSTEWRSALDAEFALNADAWGGTFDAAGRPLGFTIGAAEKTYQTYFVMVRNRGGHSMRPRPDNAIYELAEALRKIQHHRFAPQLNEITRAYFEARQQDEAGALGDAMRAWLADPANGAAADAIEASELETGMTRTRCVATMLEGGHADNALPQMARAAVNCRIMAGVEPAAIRAELQALVGPGAEVTPDPSFIGTPTPVSPLREDVLAAYTAAVRRIHGEATRITPVMDIGTTDGSFFRAAGIPTYNVDGTWLIVPEDERAHGRDERIPVRAAFDDVLHWEIMLRALAGQP